MAADTLLFLPDDEALALLPDGDGLVVFDADSGSGAECCCGGGACCDVEGWYGCNADIPHAGTLPKSDTAELHITASMRRRLWRSGNIGGGGGSDEERINTAEVALGLWWKEIDENGCTTTSGDVGPQSLHGKEVYNGSTVFDRTTTSRRRLFDPHLGHGVTSATGYRVSQWPLWNKLYGATDAEIGRMALGDVPGFGSSYTDWATYWQRLRQRPDLGWPSTLLNECAGNRVKTLNGTTYTMVWTTTLSASGGTFTGTYSSVLKPSGQVLQIEEMSVDIAWTIDVACGGTTSRGWPGCTAFIEAWIAGDAVADVNGDGFVSGDDYDLVLSAHPECFGQISSLYQSRVNRLRNVRRQAVPGALNARGLLGLP